MNETRRIVVSMDDQRLCVMHGPRCVRQFPVSTAARGMGCTPDSLRTPTGKFRICEKIGGDQEAGTIFKARVPSGHWQPGEASDDDLILTRILRLDGLEPENANTFDRCIYIHGTNREDLLGQPASHGCVRLGNREMIELFDLASVGDEVEIQPLSRRRGRLLFVEFDGVLTPCHGMLELARLRGGAVFDEVSSQVAASADGILDQEATLRALEMIRPDRAMCDEASAVCAAALVDGAGDLIATARAGGWMVVLFTCGPLPLVRDTADILGIGQIEGVSLKFSSDGSFAGGGTGFVSTGGLDPTALYADWIRALLPCHCRVVGRPPTRQLAAIDRWSPVPDRSILAILPSAAPSLGSMS